MTGAFVVFIAVILLSQSAEARSTVRAFKGVRWRASTGPARVPRGTGDSYYDRTSCPDSYEQYYSGSSSAGGGQASAHGEKRISVAGQTLSRKQTHKLARLHKKPEIKIGFLGELYPGYC